MIDTLTNEKIKGILGKKNQRTNFIDFLEILTLQAVISPAILLDIGAGARITQNEIEINGVECHFLLK